MSNSADAYLFYGYCWDEETDSLAYEDDDYEDGEDQDDEETEPRAGLITDADTWAEKVLTDRGHTNPWDSHDDTRDWLDRNRQAVDDWSTLKQSVKAEMGVGWDSHCSGESSMPFLCILESLKTSNWGDMQPITSLAVGAGWNARLAAHMEAQGVAPPEGENQPGWWLVSYWG